MVGDKTWASLFVEQAGDGSRERDEESARCCSSALRDVLCGIRDVLCGIIVSGPAIYLGRGSCMRRICGKLHIHVSQPLSARGSTHVPLASDRTIFS